MAKKTIFGKKKEKASEIDTPPKPTSKEAEEEAEEPIDFVNEVARSGHAQIEASKIQALNVSNSLLLRVAESNERIEKILADMAKEE